MDDAFRLADSLGPVKIVHIHLLLHVVDFAADL